MELGFITKAIRRYWWLVVLSIGLFGVAGSVVKQSGSATYSADALIEVAPPRGTSNSADDRYLLGQLVVLQSASFADQVAASIGQTTLGNSVKVTQIIGTDVVRVVATTGDPADAQRIANAIADVYLKQTAAQLDAQNSPESVTLTASITATKNQVDQVDSAIRDALQKYVNAGGNGNIPTVEQVAPDLATRKAVLVDTYTQLLRKQSDFDLNKQQIGSRLVQAAALPTASQTKSASLLLLAGPLVGLLLGVVAAVAAARLSAKVLDADEVAELLGVPVAAAFPRERSVAGRLSVVLENPPPTITAAANELCVLAEASDRNGDSCVVLVTGTERFAGTTTVAVAMANRFAAGGSTVLLVDVDGGNPELTRSFAAGSPGIAAMLAPRATPTTSTARRRANDHDEPRSSGGGASTWWNEAVQETPVAGLGIVGIGDRSTNIALRRQQLVSLIEAASSRAHIVVLDGGPLLDSASTVQLSQLADAVVLAVPLQRQRAKNLQVVARQLASSDGRVLPVVSPAQRTVSGPVVAPVEPVEAEVVASTRSRRAPRKQAGARVGSR